MDSRKLVAAIDRRRFFAAGASAVGLGSVGAALAAPLRNVGLGTSHRSLVLRAADKPGSPDVLNLVGHQGTVEFAAFNPDGTRVVTASDDKTARIWDAATGQEIAVLRGHEDWVWCVSYDPGGTRIVTASRDKTARVWDVATGRETASFRGHGGFVQFAAFSPDGARIVTTGDDGNARIWNAATAEEILVLRGVRESTAYFSPDGRRILTPLHDGKAGIWDAATGRLIMSLKGHRLGVSSAAYNRDGTRIVTASDDSYDTTARIWDAATGKQIAVLWNEGAVRSAAFSPDGRRVVTIDDEVGRIFDVATGRQVGQLRGGGYLHSAFFSPDGARILTALGGNAARIWANLADLPANTKIQIAVLRGHIHSVLAAAYSPDNRRIVTASVDKTVRIWDAATGKEIMVLKHDAAVYAVAFSRDGKRIVSCIGEVGEFPPCSPCISLAVCTSGTPRRARRSRISIWFIVLARFLSVPMKSASSPRSTARETKTDCSWPRPFSTSPLATR